MNALYAAEHGGCSYIRVLSRALVTHSASRLARRLGRLGLPAGQRPDGAGGGARVDGDRRKVGRLVSPRP